MPSPIRLGPRAARAPPHRKQRLLRPRVHLRQLLDFGI